MLIINAYYIYFSQFIIQTLAIEFVYIPNRVIYVIYYSIVLTTKTNPILFICINLPNMAVLLFGQESKPQTRHVMSTLTEFPPLVTQLITLEIYPIAQATLSIE